MNLLTDTLRILQMIYIRHLRWTLNYKYKKNWTLLTHNMRWKLKSTAIKENSLINQKKNLKIKNEHLNLPLKIALKQPQDHLVTNKFSKLIVYRRKANFWLDIKEIIKKSINVL